MSARSRTPASSELTIHPSVTCHRPTRLSGYQLLPVAVSRLCWVPYDVPYVPRFVVFDSPRWRPGLGRVVGASATVLMGMLSVDDASVSPGRASRRSPSALSRACGIPKSHVRQLLYAHSRRRRGGRKERTMALKRVTMRILNLPWRTTPTSSAYLSFDSSIFCTRTLHAYLNALQAYGERNKQT